MNDRISKVLQHPATIPVAVGVASFAGGVVTGYFLGRRRRKEVVVEPSDLQLNFNLNEEAVAEIKEAEKIVPEPVVLNEEDLEELDRPTPGFVQTHGKTPLKDILVIQGPDEEDDLPPQPEFAAEDGTWNFEEEIKKRHAHPMEPYIIHRDEFFEDDDEFDYTQVTLTYYAGDNIVADAQDDHPMYNYHQTLGELKFGHGSGDPGIVYIRNPKLRMDYEVLRHDGMFSVEVEGLEIENNERARDLRHANAPGRFRSD